jgi:FAD/FMN-containing dehydrogenase
MKAVTRRALTAGLIGAPRVYLSGRWIGALAADPTGPKSCIAPAGPVAEVTEASDLPGLLRGGFVDDVSCLNATPIHGRLPVRSIGDIQAAIAYARANGLTISAVGARHSMGGQAFAKDGLVLDMTGFNRIDVDEDNRTVTVEAGATWHDIQNRLHPLLAVKAMQSTDIFTVGGSISVNAHGMDHHVGALMRTICSMRVVMADGSVRDVSPSRDPELFGLIVGGYGLFGIIAEAELEVTDNVIYESGRRIVDYTDLPRVFDEDIRPDDDIGLFYAHLSTAPGAGFLREALLYTFREVGPPLDDLPPLGDAGVVKVKRLIINLAKHGTLFAKAKWFAEKQVDPLFESCTVSRQTALAEGDACLVSRNEPMHDSVPYLMNSLTGETDILHEYFVPRAKLVPFIDAVRIVLEDTSAPLLNASVRVVHREDNALTYAPEDAFSLVLYVNQSVDAAGNAKMAGLTGLLIEATLDAGGRFFLPYQLHYDAGQLARSYPEISGFFASKRRYDPDGLFTNTFHQKYADSILSG